MEEYTYKRYFRCPQEQAEFMRMEQMEIWGRNASKRKVLLSVDYVKYSFRTKATKLDE